MNEEIWKGNNFALKINFLKRIVKMYKMYFIMFWWNTYSGKVMRGIFNDWMRDMCWISYLRRRGVLYCTKYYAHITKGMCIEDVTVQIYVSWRRIESTDVLKSNWAGHYGNVHCDKNCQQWHHCTMLSFVSAIAHTYINKRRSHVRFTCSKLKWSYIIHPITA